MKDKALRKALGMHGFEENLCGCSSPCAVDTGWQGEIPMLWKRIEELESKIKAIEEKESQ